MIVCFLRHGKADPPDKVADEQRQLLEQGRRDIRAASKVWRRMQIQPDAVLTSPRQRSVDSASLFAEGFGLQPAIANELAPGAAWSDLAGLLERHLHHTALVLVGHEPALSRSVEYLTGAKAIVLREGGICCVELRGGIEQASAGLMLLLDPKMYQGEGA